MHGSLTRAEKVGNKLKGAKEGKDQSGKSRKNQEAINLQ